MLTRIIPAVAAMAAVVILSNFLVQFPVQIRLGSLNFADLLTWGAFTYPMAFLVNDLTNRHFGPGKARLVVLCGFVLAVLASIYLASPRIAMASGAAFLGAQLLDTAIFDRLRASDWWRAPLISSFIGSVLDTLVFFTLAFSASFAAFGPTDAFAVAQAPLLGLFSLAPPRWISWAVGDFGVKMLVALIMLAPYSLLRRWVSETAASPASK